MKKKRAVEGVSRVFVRIQNRSGKVAGDEQDETNTVHIYGKNFLAAGNIHT